MADAMNASKCSPDGEITLPYTIPEMVVIALLAGTLSLITVLGNSMVMISFKIDRQLQTISNYFLFSLAVADLAIGLISMPLFTVSTLLGYWPLGRHICDTWLALDYLASNASVLNLLIISFDRYFSVTRPLTYRAKRTTGKAAIMIAGAWGISLLLWPPWIYAWPYIEGKRTVPETECYIQFIETNHYITFGTAIAAFYIPVSVMIVLYYRIWRETKKRQKDLPNLQAGRNGRTTSSRRSTSRLNEECDLPLDDIRRLRYGSGVDFYPRRKKFKVLTWDWCKHSCLTWWHAGREDESYDFETPSEAGVGTPSSLDTPLQPSVSRTTSFMQDPYAPSTSAGQVVTHPQVHWRGPPSTASTPTQTPSTPIIDGHAEGEEEDEALANTKGGKVYASIPDEGVYTIVIQLPKLNEEGEPDPEDKASIKLLHNEIPEKIKEKYGLGTRRRAPSYNTERKDAATDTEEDLNQITASSPGSTLGRRPSTIPEKIPYILPKTIIRGPKKKKKVVEKKQDKKAARTLTAILLSFIITWTPYNVLVLLKPVTSGYTCIPQQLWDFFYYLCYINSTINPVCYALCNASFRRTYVRILTCRWHGRERVGVNRSGVNN